MEKGYKKTKGKYDYYVELFEQVIFDTKYLDNDKSKIENVEKWDITLDFYDINKVKYKLNDKKISSTKEIRNKNYLEKIESTFSELYFLLKENGEIDTLANYGKIIEKWNIVKKDLNLGKLDSKEIKFLFKMDYIVRNKLMEYSLIKTGVLPVIFSSILKNEFDRDREIEFDLNIEKMFPNIIIPIKYKGKVKDDKGDLIYISVFGTLKELELDFHKLKEIHERVLPFKKIDRIEPKLQSKINYIYDKRTNIFKEINMEYIFELSPIIKKKGVYNIQLIEKKSRIILKETKVKKIEKLPEIIKRESCKYPELNDFISNCKKTKDFDNNKFLELIENLANLTLNTNKEKLDLVFEINNITWDFPYYDIRDEERKMNLDGRYERKKILEGLVKKLNIELSELVHYKDIEEIKEKVKRYNLNEDVSGEDFLILYNLINSFYNEMLETICTESFYIWNDYKTKLSEGKEEGAEEEYRKRLAGNKEEKKKVVENFNDILGSIGLKR